MSGCAVTIDWERPIAPNATNRMLALIPHRAGAGTRTVRFETASLGEARMREPAGWQITRHEGLTIVGDIRLWNRDSLRASAGGLSVTQSMDNRRLLIEAYRRNGIGFLDHVDGDFAFVIWDDDRRRAIAVRDRFGVKPLFFERTRSGVRFASEVKQLVAASDHVVEPSNVAVAEYLSMDSLDARQTFSRE
jgi:asparagine synthase (glutamine-hydrolysing)